MPNVGRKVVEVGGHFWQDGGSENFIDAHHEYYATKRNHATVAGLTTTAGLIERLAVDRALRRICRFPQWKKLPGESTFSQAFAEFAEAGLAERVHAALVRETLGDTGG